MPITIIIPTLTIALLPSIFVIKNAVCVREQKGYGTWEQFPFHEWKITPKRWHAQGKILYS